MGTHDPCSEIITVPKGSVYPAEKWHLTITDFVVISIYGWLGKRGKGRGDGGIGEQGRGGTREQMRGRRQGEGNRGGRGGREEESGRYERKGKKESDRVRGKNILE